MASLQAITYETRHHPPRSTLCGIGGSTIANAIVSSGTPDAVVTTGANWSSVGRMPRDLCSKGQRLTPHDGSQTRLPYLDERVQDPEKRGLPAWDPLSRNRSKSLARRFPAFSTFDPRVAALRQLG